MGDHTPEQRPAGQADLIAWQRQARPLLMVMIIGLTVFFFGASFMQFTKLQQEIAARAADPGVVAAIDAYERSIAASEVDHQYLQWKVESLSKAQNDRANLTQGNALLLVNMWTRYLGFVTGMLLTILGSVFIFAKLSDQVTTLAGSTSAAKFSLATASPGIVLAVLGTLLMVTAMSVDYRETETVTRVSDSGTDGARQQDTGIPPGGTEEFLENDLDVGPESPPANAQAEP